MILKSSLGKLRGLSIRLFSKVAFFDRNYTIWGLLAGSEWRVAIFFSN